MTYNQPYITQIVELERVSPSGTVRKYKVLPAAGNRVAVVLHLDPIPERNRWTKDLWHVTQFDTEEEFKSRCGQELFDLIVSAFDNPINLDIDVRLFSVKPIQTPIDLSDVVWDGDNTDLFYILKAKLTFLQLVIGIHHRLDGIYSGLTDTQIFESRKRIEREFNACVKTNLAYIQSIVDKIRPVYDKWGSYQTLSIEFELFMDGWLSPRFVHKAAKSTDVCQLLDQLEQFLASCRRFLEEENASNIIALGNSYSVAHKALEHFKLFEHD